LRVHSGNYVRITSYPPSWRFGVCSHRFLPSTRSHRRAG
jgi:hypothetical protein